MPAVNHYTGDVAIRIGGHDLTLAYDWLAISAIRSGLGTEGQAAALAGDLGKLAELVAIGLRRHHSDWNADCVTAASPPIKPTIAAIETALTAAWFGPDGIPKDMVPENPPPPHQGMPTRCGKLWRRLTGQA